MEDERKVVTSEQYNRIRDDLRKDYDYDNMTDSQKELFDRTVDSRMKVEGDSSDDGDRAAEHRSVQPREPAEKRSSLDELKEHYGYDDMTDKQKENFDKALDSVIEEREQERTADREDTVERGRSR
jgi:predicted nucleic acid-binding OB-fold protein